MSPISLYATALLRLWGSPVTTAHDDATSPTPRVALAGDGWTCVLTWEQGAMRQRGRGLRRAKRLARWLSEPGSVEAWRLWRARMVVGHEEVEDA